MSVVAELYQHYPYDIPAELGLRAANEITALQHELQNRRLQMAIPTTENYSGSLGAARVRESFNPSKDDLVTKIKRYTADLIDLCNEQAGKNTSLERDSEENRLWMLAMTHYEDAAMWAVKAATTPKK